MGEEIQRCSFPYLQSLAFTLLTVESPLPLGILAEAHVGVGEKEIAADSGSFGAGFVTVSDVVVA